MREEQSSLALFTGEFAKCQYYTLYNSISIQGHLPIIVYPEILLFVKTEMETLRLNDSYSLAVFLSGLAHCLAHVAQTKEQGSQFEQSLKTIFHGNLLTVYNAIFNFVKKNAGQLDRSNVQFSKVLPSFTSEMQKRMSSETYVKSELPSVKLV